MQKEKFNAKRANGFMKVYVDLFDVLSPEATLVLSDLIDIEPTIKKWEGEYARISYSFIQERLGWSNHIIRNALKEIEEVGFIKTKELRINENRRSVNAVFIYVDHAKLHEYLDVDDDVDDDINDDINDDVDAHVKNFNVKQNNRLTDKQNNILTDKSKSLSSKKSKSSSKKNDDLNDVSNNDDLSEPTSSLKVIDKDISGAGAKPAPQEVPTPAPIKENSCNLADIITWINQQSFSPSTKDAAINFYKNLVANIKARYTVGQVKQALSELWNDCNGDEQWIQQSLHNSYVSNWRKPYASKRYNNSYNPQAAVHCNIGEVEYHPADEVF